MFLKFVSKKGIVRKGSGNDTVLQEIQALVEAAEFMHYWSRKGCTLELETEYEP